MTKRTNWRVQREHERRRSALLTLLENAELRPHDRLNAESMLQGLDQHKDTFKAGQQALKEVDQLRQDNAALVAEVARLKDDLAETNATLTEANDWIEAHQSANQVVPVKLPQEVRQ